MSTARSSPPSTALALVEDPPGEVLEGRSPAGAVTLTRLQRGEPAVFEHYRRGVAVGTELDRHQAHGSGVRAVAALPAPRVDEPARAHDLAVLAADDVQLSGLVVAHAHDVAPADAQVDLAARRRPGRLHGPPALQHLGVRPGVEDLLRRGGERPLQAKRCDLARAHVEQYL